MSVGYTSVQWNGHKKVYDFVLVAGILLAIGAFAAVSLAVKPGITAETLIIRGTAVAAFLLLHVILAIGPLARFDRSFLPLLYNRRHLGVAMFLLGLVHAVFSTIQFHALGDANPLVSMLGAYRQDYALFRGGELNLAHFPFEALGAAALVIFFLMAATSHDFWLKNLGASTWKALHVLVLLAYGLIVLHVTLGALQSERSGLYPFLLAFGGLALLGLHGAAGWKEAKLDREKARAEEDGFERACPAAAVPEGWGKTVRIAGERLAVFRREDKIFALSNVCRHQGGPLGEGKIIDGCITCPWHGWQYKPEDGCSPPPFTEVVPTYRVRLVGEDVWIHPEPLELQATSPGVPAPPAAPKDAELYVGYLPVPAGLKPRLKAVALALLILAPVAAGLAAWAQKPFDSGVFEFGVTRTFEGILYEEPVPVLRLDADGGAAASVLLSSFGKHGLPEEARGHHGARVTFEGSLVYRRGLTMIEMNVPRSFRVIVAATGKARPPLEDLGSATLEGEIVDTKCFFGVMRPAAGKVHRACAVRCLSGGVPPGLLVRDDENGGTVVLLAGPEGKALDLDVQWAGRRVRAGGKLQLLDGVPVLRATEIKLTD